MNLRTPTLFSMAFLLAACATDGQAPVTHEALIQTAVVCVKPEQVPQAPKPTPIAAGATAKQKAAALGADIKAQDAYIAQADALLHQCSQ